MGKYYHKFLPMPPRANILIVGQEVKDCTLLILNLKAYPLFWFALYSRLCLLIEYGIIITHKKLVTNNDDVLKGYMQQDPSRDERSPALPNAPLQVMPSFGACCNLRER